MSNVQCPTSRLVIGHSTLDICLSYGEGGIRTPDRGISPYNGLANRRLQPLGHLSNETRTSRVATACATPCWSRRGPWWLDWWQNWWHTPRPSPLLEPLPRELRLRTGLSIGR